jgi:antitoxin component YwqK of YwqJK toxin-antitoxin module
MKFSFLFFSFLVCTMAQGQYYYKDIVGTAETREMMKAYLASKVKRVQVRSYDAENTRTDNIYVEQYFSAAELKLNTITRTDSSDESILTSYINAEGQVLKTVDSSESMLSTTIYNYDKDGNPVSITSLTGINKNTIAEKEVHNWIYKDGKISRMLRIKNDIDTSFVDFKTDENGNIAEEQITRKGVKHEPVYYYYNKENRISDIVRFNQKAQRLLPEYMFEYSPSGQVIQRITVPANGSKYLIWRYQYDSRGLKTKEAVYDRYKQVQGRVEYLYSFGS